MPVETPATPMLPRTPKELTDMLVGFGLLTAYGALANAAWRKRLTNADIAAIERSVLDGMRETARAAEEFKEFEAEPAIAAALAQLRDQFQSFANTRTKG